MDGEVGAEINEIENGCEKLVLIFTRSRMGWARDMMESVVIEGNYEGVEEISKASVINKNKSK